MPRIKQLEFKLKLPRDGNRSKGLHVSDIIRDLAFRHGYLDIKWKDNDIESDPERAVEGLAFEKWLFTEHYNHILHQPGEVTLDGIAGSPDGLSFDPDILHECKFTWKSLPKRTSDLVDGNPKWWMYLTQIQAYLKMLNMRTCHLHIYFVNGNYKWDHPQGVGTCYRVYEMKFSTWELDENWAMIRNHAKHLRRTSK